MIRTTLACAVAVLAIPAAAFAAPSTADFLAKASASDKFEVAAGKLAEIHGGSAAVKKFGKEMTVDHTKSTKMVKAAVKASHLPAPPPPMFDEQQKAAIADLQGKKGKAFDDAYIAGQKDAHQQALELMQSYSQDGDNPRLKATAGKIVPVVQMHIDMLNKMGG